MSEATADLPELTEAIFDEPAMRQYLADLASCARVIEVRTKSAPTRSCSNSCTTLQDAMHQLQAGTARGVQIRYIHDGIEWCDTLLRSDGGTRIVRMRNS